MGKEAIAWDMRERRQGKETRTGRTGKGRQGRSDRESKSREISQGKGGWGDNLGAGSYGWKEGKERKPGEGISAKGNRGRGSGDGRLW